MGEGVELNKGPKIMFAPKSRKMNRHLTKERLSKKKKKKEEFPCP